MLLVDRIADIQSTSKFRAAKNKGKQPAAPAAKPTGVTKPSPSPRGGGGRTQSGRRGGCATSKMKQEKQSRSAAAAAALQSQWVSVPGPSALPPMPAHTPDAGSPLTPARTPEQHQQPALVGAGMLDEAYRVDLSGYQLADVAGVWSGVGPFGGMPEQLQWYHPGTPGDA